MSSKSFEIVKCLKELIKCKYGIYPPKEVLARSERFLTLVCAVSTKQLPLNKEEKKKISSLVLKAFSSIKFNIECTRYCPSHWMRTPASEKKHALQYLIDNFSDLPVGSKMTADNFKEINFELILMLDEIRDKKLVLTDSSDKTLDFSTKETMSSKSSELLECFKEMKNSLYISVPVKVLEKSEKCLLLVSSLGTEQLIKEKQEIGPLIEESLTAIIFNIKRTRHYSGHWLRTTVSEKKRALQYLVNVFADFPVGSKTLSMTFKKINIKKLIEILDRTKDEKWIPDIPEDLRFSSYISIWDKSSELIKCLKSLVKYSYGMYTTDEIVSLSEEFLLLVYAIRTEQLTLKKEEKQQIGPLVSEALAAVKFNILTTISGANRWARATAFEKKYVLQYLINYYSDCPVGSATLATKFKEINIEEFIAKLDEIKDEEYVITDESDYDEFVETDESDYDEFVVTDESNDEFVMTDESLDEFVYKNSNGVLDTNMNV